MSPSPDYPRPLKDIVDAPLSHRTSVEGVPFKLRDFLNTNEGKQLKENVVDKITEALANPNTELRRSELISIQSTLLQRIGFIQSNIDADMASSEQIQELGDLTFILEQYLVPNISPDEESSADVTTDESLFNDTPREVQNLLRKREKIEELLVYAESNKSDAELLASKILDFVDSLHEDLREAEEYIQRFESITPSIDQISSHRAEVKRLKGIVTDTQEEIESRLFKIWSENVEFSILGLSQLDKILEYETGLLDWDDLPDIERFITTIEEVLTETIDTPEFSRVQKYELWKNYTNERVEKVRELLEILEQKLEQKIEILEQKKTEKFTAAEKERMKKTLESMPWYKAYLAELSDLSVDSTMSLSDVTARVSELEEINRAWNTFFQTDEVVKFIPELLKQDPRFLEKLEKLRKLKEDKSAPELERNLNRTQESVLYFLEQKRVPWLKDLKKELNKGDPSAEYIHKVNDLIFIWMSDAINDWRGDNKSERTANWNQTPFYGPIKEFSLREAAVITPYQQFNVTSLENFLDNFGSLYQDPATLEIISKMRERIFGQLSQYEVLHNRAAVARSMAKKETPDGTVDTFNTLKNNKYSVELGKLFPSSEKMKEMSEMEKRISVGTEFVFRIFCAQSLKDYERDEFAETSYMMDQEVLPGVVLPSVAKYLDPKGLDEDEFRYEQLPYYRTQDKVKLLTLLDEIIKDLKKIGIDDEAALWLCIEGGTSASIGLGIDTILDWEEFVKDGKLVSTINASQDAGPKALLPAYLRSTEKDLEKKKPNVAISDYIGQAVATYAQTACYTFVDVDGVRRRDSLARIVVRGLVRTVDWSTGTTNPDQSVSDQLNTYYGVIYKDHAFCNTKNAPFGIKARRSEIVDSAREFEDVKRYLGIAPEDTFANIAERVNRFVEEFPLTSRFFGNINIWDMNYLWERPKLEQDGHELHENELTQLAESYYQKLLVDFRQYWLTAITIDGETYPWDTVVRLRTLFTTKANRPGLEGAINEHIKNILFDPDLYQVSPPLTGETPSAEYVAMSKKVKSVMKKIKSYIKYGMLQEMVLYYYMPLYRNNAKFMEFMSTTDDNKIAKIIRKPRAYKHDLEALNISTTAGFPVLTTREYDVLLSGMREIAEKLAQLSKTTTKEDAADFQYSFAYDPADPTQPFKKKKALGYIQDKYNAAPGTSFQDMSNKSKTKGHDWQLRPINRLRPGVQGVINLIRLRGQILSDRKTR